MLKELGKCLCWFLSEIERAKEWVSNERMLRSVQKSLLEEFQDLNPDDSFPAYMQPDNIQLEDIFHILI